jgi:hypothetical protein
MIDDDATSPLEGLETAALENATGGNVRAFLAVQKKLKDPSYSLLKDGFDLKQVPGTTDRWTATRGSERYQVRAHDTGWQLMPFIR